ncbi:S41 family peptidase [Pseudidiomarina aestuarii]|uniref:S41 family peptidase n=1 Tax=Pseudidiomarina aestuarii TaxID=624146 RepID=UPI003A977418
MKNCLLILLFALSVCANAQDKLLDFKADTEGKLVEWTASPDGAIFLDTEVLYNGRPSVKFDRRDISTSSGSFIIRRVPLIPGAQVIELRAVLRAKATGPWAGANILLRQDKDEKAIEFSNSQPFITGASDTDWQSVRISQKVNPQTESLVIGAVLGGPGEAWVNDLELWVDGELLTSFADADQTATKPADNARDHIVAIDIDWGSLEDETIRDLSAFIQVWGFLKYFHPGVAQGEQDWDLEFIKATHEIVTGTELDNVLIPLLDKIGVPATEEVKVDAIQQNLIASLSSQWYLNDDVFSPKVINLLSDLASNRHSFTESRYAISNELEMASFTGEGYFQVNYLEHELRLLALARLWNVFEYWFPYESNESWYATLQDLTKQVVKSSDRSDFLITLQTLLGQVNDSHANMTESIFRQGPCQLPFTVRYLEGHVVINRIYKDIPQHDIKIGDKIIALDGESFEDLFERWLPLYSASNEQARFYGLANNLLFRSCNEPTVVTIGRQSKQFDVSVSEYETIANANHALPGDVVQTLEDDVTYLKVVGVDFDAVDEALEKAQQSGKLIIDVRGYPSEFILYYLASRLTEKPLPFAQLARVHPNSPGNVVLIDHTPTIEPSEPIITLGGIAILVDEATLSQSEFSALAWRELPNSIVIGSTTAGAIGNVSSVPLPNGMHVFFTGLRVLDNTGQDVQHRGIVPDIFTKPTIADLQSGRDVVIDTAIEWLHMKGK